MKFAMRLTNHGRPQKEGVELMFNDHDGILSTQYEVSVIITSLSGKAQTVEKIGVIDKKEVVRLGKAT